MRSTSRPVSTTWVLRYAAFFALLLLAPLRGDAAEPTGTWSALGEKDGVRMWRLDVPGRIMPGFRGDVVIAADSERIVSELERVDQHTQWMYRCAESRVVQRFDRDHALIYNRTDTPWPVWDRDAVLETQIARPSQSQVTLSFKNVEQGSVATPKRVVRIPKLEGAYTLSTLEPGKTRVTYQVELDIGGSVPQWVAERVARDMPYQTLSRLRERITGKD